MKPEPHHPMAHCSPIPYPFYPRKVIFNTCDIKALAHFLSEVWLQFNSCFLPSAPRGTNREKNAAARLEYSLEEPLEGSVKQETSFTTKMSSKSLH